LEREQERGEKVKRKKGNKSSDTKTKRGGTIANIAKTSNMAKEARDTSTTGLNRAYTNGRSRKDKCGNNAPLTEGRGCTKKPLCHGCE